MASSPPAPAPPTVDLVRSFRFVLDDPEWLKKILIGGAFTLASTFIVGIFFVAGYWVRLLKRVAAGEASPLPEWDDLGGIFEDGLPIVGVYFVHVLGVLVLLAGFGCAGGLFVFGLGGLSRGSHEAAEAVGALGAMGFAGLYVVLILVGLAMNVYLPAAFVRVALRGEFKVGFDWRANLAFIRANPANYALSLVVSLVAHFVAQVGILLCCVGVFPCAFWAHLTLAFALAETVRLNPRSV
jgi:Protein of unknown function (DUF4013)